MVSNVWAVQRWRTKTKEKLVLGFGGKCNKCGYSICNNALEFHHLNESSKKEFTISSALKTPKKWEVLVQEVQKCILLCNRCHRELHDSIWKLSDIELVRFDVSIADEPTGYCSCGDAIYSGRPFCSRACAAKKARTVLWPDGDQLQQRIRAEGMNAVAVDLGVSKSSISKRLKKLNRVIILACPTCECEFKAQSKSQRYCSPSCAHKAARRAVRPPKEQLEEEIMHNSWVSLGKKYGVSDNAVKKWARGYGLAT